MENVILIGDCIEKLRELPDCGVNTCVTSPPYWGLRDYGVDGQIGAEESPEAYVERIVTVFREVKRVLRDDGTLWLNLGDSYAANVKAGDKRFGNPEFNANRPSRELTKTPARTISDGLKPKDLVGIPWRVAFALQADGWYLRSDFIWHKPNVMPESVRDRPTKAHEYIFLLTKSERYYYDSEAIKEGAVGVRGGTPKKTHDKAAQGIHGTTSALNAPWKGSELRNRRTVWTVSTKPFRGAHFATFPPDLIEPCVLAGCPEGGIVLDPFFGAGTTGLVAQRNKRIYVGIELNPQYAEIAADRIRNDAKEAVS
jgi:DNA modification methylase